MADDFRNADPDGQLGYAQVEYGFESVVEELLELKLLRCDDALEEKLIGRGDAAGEVARLEVDDE